MSTRRIETQPVEREIERRERMRLINKEVLVERMPAWFKARAFDSLRVDQGMDNIVYDTTEILGRSVGRKLIDAYELGGFDVAGQGEQRDDE